MRLAITGHRPAGFKQEEHEAIRRALRHELNNLAPSVLIVGMAQGFDTWALEWALSESAASVGCRVHACFPYPAHVERWPEEERRHAEWLVSELRSHCGLEAVSICSPSYGPGVYHKRNRFLVEQCDSLLAGYAGGYGGTRYTMDYARKLGKPVRSLRWQKP